MRLKFIGLSILFTSLSIFSNPFEAVAGSKYSSKVVSKILTTKSDGSTKTTYCAQKSLTASNKAFVAVKKAGSKYVKSAKSADISVCNKLKNLKSQAKNLELSKIQDASSAFESTESSSLGLSLKQVSGSPPTLLAIASGTPTIGAVLFGDDTLEKIISHNASEDQCFNFFGSNVDGQSAGLGAGFMLGAAGNNIQNSNESAGTLCYMKNMANQDLLDSGTLAVVSGSLPTSGVEDLLKAAPTSSKTVKVNVTQEEGQMSVFMRVPSAKTNTANGDAYAVKLWFCKQGVVDSIEDIKVKLSGQLITKSIGDEEGAVHVASFTSMMKYINGELVHDLSRDRVSEVEFARPGGESARLKLLLTSDGKMRSWENAVFGGSARKSFSIIESMGSSMDDLAILAGAYKETGDRGTHEPNAFEYRDDHYVSAPGSALVAELNLVSFEDPFFTSLASPSVDLSGFSCDTTPTIELDLNMQSSGGEALSAQCEGKRIQGMDFMFQNEQVQQAMENYGLACFPS